MVADDDSDLDKSFVQSAYNETSTDCCPSVSQSLISSNSCVDSDQNILKISISINLLDSIPNYESTAELSINDIDFLDLVKN